MIEGMKASKQTGYFTLTGNPFVDGGMIMEPGQERN